MSVKRSNEPNASEESVRLVRVAEAAKFLGISERKLWELTSLGEIRRVRIGRAVRYDLVDLGAWIEQKKRGASVAMASVFKRSDGGKWWMMQFIDERGRRVHRSSRTTDKRAATRIAAQLEADAALARNGLKDRTGERRAKAHSVPLQEHLDEYFDQCEQAGQAKRHIQNKRSHLKGVVKAVGAEGLGDIEPATLQKHLSKLQKGDAEKKIANRSARTVNAVRASVIAFMSWCVKNGFVADNPLLAIPTFDGNDR